MTDKQKFNELVSTVRGCNKCLEMDAKNGVLSHMNGSIDSKVLFVAEAPGRLGAERTRIPLHGDKTGDNFEALLQHINWDRNDLFITNAVLCNPTKNGNNRTPYNNEIKKCSVFLNDLISLIQPFVVVTLGVIALKAIGIVHPPTCLTLKNSVGKLIRWNGRYLYPLYHISPRAMIHRPREAQECDFEKLSTIIHPVKGLLWKNFDGEEDLNDS